MNDKYNTYFRLHQSNQAPSRHSHQQADVSKKQEKDVAGINKVIIVGNLGGEPELKSIGNNNSHQQAVVSASQEPMTLQPVIFYGKYCCVFQPLEKGRNQQL
jgi:hypothetical protein